MQLPSFITEIPKHQLIGYAVLVAVLLFVIFFVYGNTSIGSMSAIKSMTKKKSNLTAGSIDVTSNLLSMIDDINQRQERNINLKNSYLN